MMVDKSLYPPKPSRANPEGRVVISVVFTTNPGKLEIVQEIVASIVAQARKLPGTIAFRLFTFQHDNVDKLRVVQEYKDLAAFDAFLASGISGATAKRLKTENLIESGNWETYDEIEF